MLAPGARSQTPAEREMIRITQPPRPAPTGNFTGTSRIDSSFQS
jgi:hypothetical protein